MLRSKVFTAQKTVDDLDTRTDLRSFQCRLTHRVDSSTFPLCSFGPPLGLSYLVKGLQCDFWPCCSMAQWTAISRSRRRRIRFRPCRGPQVLRPALKSCAVSLSSLRATRLCATPGQLAWRLKAFSVPLFGAENKFAFFRMSRVRRLQISLRFVFLQIFVRQHCIAQHALPLRSSTIIDRSESQIHRFLTVGLLAHT